MGPSFIVLAAVSLMMDNWTFDVQQPDTAFTVVTEEPSVVPDPPIAEPVRLEQQYRLDMFTASWCGPCRNWKANEKRRVESAGIVVREIDTDRVRGTGISRIPHFRLIRLSDGAAVSNWTGYVNTSTLQAAMQRDSAARQPAVVKTDQKLVSAPKTQKGGKFYNSSIYTGERGTIHENRESLISHLLNDGIHRGRHSFAELSSLSDDALNLLHNREHGWR